MRRAEYDAAMTEAEWLACTDPQLMVGFLSGEVVTLVDGPLSTAERERMRLHVERLLVDRKSRLLAGECAGAIGGLLTGGEGAASAAPAADRFPLHAPAGRFAEPAKLAARYAARAARSAARPRVVRWLDVTEALEDSAFAAVWGGLFSSLGDAGRWQSVIVRDIFGNPFRPVTPDPAWLTPAVVALAHTIYDGRAFDRMPELADALETAGCDDADVLDHCRNGGEHVRGCWVVDLVLGKS